MEDNFMLCCNVMPNSNILIYFSCIESINMEAPNIIQEIALAINHRDSQLLESSHFFLFKVRITLESSDEYMETAVKRKKYSEQYIGSPIIWFPLLLGLLNRNR